MLTGSAIAEAVECGDIEISPFFYSQLNPNSYNVRIRDTIATYPAFALDMFKKYELVQVAIPNEGLLLYPNQLYLAETAECTYSSKYIPLIEGRSSAARLGLGVHISAGFGDLGFRGTWTLELTVVQPLRIYAWTEIAQVCFITPSDLRDSYSGRYQNQTGIVGSRFYQTDHLDTPQSEKPTC